MKIFDLFRMREKLSNFETLGSSSKHSFNKNFLPAHLDGADFKKGDFIDPQNEVVGILGQGGMGTVYLVHSHTLERLIAIKTIRQEFMTLPLIERFKREAKIMISLGTHPYILKMIFVQEIQGRLHIAMEYVPPDRSGATTVQDHIFRSQTDLAATLHWSLQLCYGMEFAYSKGIKSHRDIKPSNILISDGTTVRIADFGLAATTDTERSATIDRQQSATDKNPTIFETQVKSIIGTPRYMAPEQFVDPRNCDERTDIYSMGIVIYEMLSQGRFPLRIVRTNKHDMWNSMKIVHQESPIIPLDTPVFSIIERALKKDPAERFPSFASLREHLSFLSHKLTGIQFRPLKYRETDRAKDRATEFHNKGFSYHNLKLFQKALDCYEAALKLDPSRVLTWQNKGNVLRSLDRNQEAIKCFDQAIALDETFFSAWEDKAYTLVECGTQEAVFEFCDNASIKFPTKQNIFSHLKGLYLQSHGNDEEAIRYFNNYLKNNPRGSDAYYLRGNSLRKLGKLREAVKSYEFAVKYDSLNFRAWHNLGICHDGLEEHGKALDCYIRATEAAPGDALSWNGRAKALSKMGRFDESIQCYDKAIMIKPEDANAWFDKGVVYNRMGLAKRALDCYAKVVKVDRKHWMAWYNKARTEDAIGEVEAAIDSYENYINFSPPNEHESRKKAEDYITVLKIGLSISIFNESCMHSQYVLKNCLSWDDAGYYIQKAREKGRCTICGHNLDGLCLVIMKSDGARASVDADSTAIDMRITKLEKRPDLIRNLKIVEV